MFSKYSFRTFQQKSCWARSGHQRQFVEPTSEKFAIPPDLEFSTDQFPLWSFFIRLPLCAICISQHCIVLYCIVHLRAIHIYKLRGDYCSESVSAVTNLNIHYIRTHTHHVKSHTKGNTAIEELHPHPPTVGQRRFRDSPSTIAALTERAKRAGGSRNSWGGRLFSRAAAR